MRWCWCWRSSGLLHRLARLCPPHALLAAWRRSHRNRRNAACRSSPGLGRLATCNATALHRLNLDRRRLLLATLLLPLCTLGCDFFARNTATLHRLNLASSGLLLTALLQPLRTLLLQLCPSGRNLLARGTTTLHRLDLARSSFLLTLLLQLYTLGRSLLAR